MPAKYIAIVVSVSLLMGASGCRDRETEPSATPPASEAEGAGDASLVSSGRPLFGPAPDAGITFRLSDAEPGAPAADRIPVTDAVPLSPERVDELLALLPPMPETASEQVTFALRPGPEPPVLTGDEIQAPFPPLDEAGPPPEVPVGALEVLRYQPEGDIALASHLSVTFSEPMVPLTSHAALADRDVPVRLEPEPAGEWRWVGSRTLVFEPEPRFPMATEFSVEVPAGTAAENDNSLAEAVTWSFRTPPPSLVSRHPVGGPTDRRPVVLLAFDQAIEAEAVLGHTSMTADGAVVELRLASAEEVAADTEAAAMARRMQHEDRWLALRPATDLPMGATAEVVIGAGLPSAEGPRVTEEPDSFEFQVYGPLKVDGVRCEGESRAWEWSSASQAKIGCLPLAPLGIKFTNDLDTDAFDPTAVEVEPEIPGAQLIAAGNTITIAGATRGRTRYTVRLPEGLLDVYGNTLTGTKTVVFETGDARATLVAPGGDMIVLDPGGPATLDLMSINNDQLDVRLYKVVPDDWPAYLTYVQQGGFPGEQGGQKAQPPGELAWSGSVPVSGERDALAVAPIDLSPALSGSVGQVVAIVEPAGWSSRDDNWSNRPVRRWVQATQLGLDVFADSSDVLVWVTRLADGEPVQGATARLAPGTETAGTAEDGTAVLRPLAERNQSWPSPVRVEARLGDDVTFLPEGVSPSPWSDYYGGGGWSGSEPGERLTWYVFDDRGLYKPGEVAQVKGWIRRDSSGKGGDVKPLGTPVDVEYRFVARNGREITTGAVTTDEWGGFHLALDVPTDVELGVASVELVARVAGMPEGWGNHWYGLQIGEYRRPEFEVSTTAEAPSYLIDQQGVAVVTAEYYAGGVLPGAETTWDVTAVATTYSPPGHDDFVFGDWRPWWRWDPWYGGGEQAYQAHQGVTDATGKHRLGVDIDSVEPLSPVTVDAQATVMDVNRQAWTSAAALLFHPAEVYVGLRPDRWFKEAGEEFTLDIIAADIEGELVPGLALNVAAARLGWEYKGGDYSETFEPAGSCEVVSGDEPVACRLSFDAGGEYRIVAEVIDVAGRPNLTQLSLWVPGGQTAPSRGLESEQVTLVPGSRYYQPGDKAEILVQSPFAPAEGLLTVRRSGVVHHETFTMDEPTIRLYVPIEDGYQPNITVQVDLVGAKARDLGAAGSGVVPGGLAAGEGAGADAGAGAAAGAGADDEGVAADLQPRPAFATGAVELEVPPTNRTLQVEARAAAESLEPGESTSIEVTVRDPDGDPVADAGVALVVVDESVLALTGHTVPDPIEVFYWRRSPDTMDSRQRAFVQLADVDRLLAESAAIPAEADGIALRSAAPAAAGGIGSAMGMDVAEGVVEEMAEAEMAYGDESVALKGEPMFQSLRATAPPPPPRTGGPDVSTPPPAPRERVDLDPLAAFAPDLRTDTDGRVSLNFDLPDSVTRYRITAVVTDGAQEFGKAESQITARLPVIVRPSAPRFLNYGDVFELPVVVQNQTDEPLSAEVVVRAANLALTDSAGYAVDVPAGDRVEVRFPAAAVMPGTAAFQAGAFSPVGSDAQRVTLPVWTPATTEAFATYGEIDDGAISQPVERPPDVVDEFGGLVLTTSSTALSSLTDAFLYLETYPFECSEQIASRMIATVALEDVLAAFGAKDLPSPEEIDASINRDIERLQTMQNPDGGFGWWRPGEESRPFPTVHVTHSLARAAAKGYQVDGGTRDRALDYLRNIGSHLDAAKYSGRSRWSLEAYALVVRGLLDDPDPVAGRELFERADEPTVDTLGWLLQVLSGDPQSAEEVSKIRRQLGNRVSEEAGTAQFASGYSEVDGNLVLASDRRSDAIVLEALTIDEPESDLIPKLVRGLLGHRQRGRWGSTQENAFVLLALDRYFRQYESVEPDFVARAWLGEGYIGDQRFAGRSPDSGRVDVPMAALSPDGDDVVLSKEGPGRLYYRLGMDYAPQDLELEPLERGFSVERVYEPVDDPGDVRRTADGSWHIKPGARVRVKLTMVAPQRRYHVALVDPLPAGLEALNPDLAVTGDIEPPVLPAEPYLLGDVVEVAVDQAWRPWVNRWYEHESFRDERVEAFGGLVQPGLYTYTYVARATTPGRFVVPPTKAEEMYHPETFGRSGSEVVVVE